MDETGLRFETVTKGHRDRAKIKKLYLDAFPVYERIPFWLLMRKTKTEGVKLFGVYDGDIFIGMVYLMKWRDIVYIQYLAVDRVHRGNGYGGRVLSALKARYGGYRFIPEIEEVSADAKNYEERKRRQAFYERNGFYEPGLLLTEQGVRYYFMTAGGFGIEEYLEMTRAFRGKLLSLLSGPVIEERG